MHAWSAFVLFADFFDKSAGHEVLKFFVGAQAQHFFAAADGVANFKICKNTLKKIVETENFLFGKDVAKLVSNMVGKATGESGAFRGNCHNDVTIHPS